MKKNTLVALHTYFTEHADALDADIIADIEAELARRESGTRTPTKAERERHELYASVKPIILDALGDNELTAKELFAQAESKLPAGFSAAKVQAALLRYYADDVEVIDNGKNAKTYRRRKAS